MVQPVLVGNAALQLSSLQISTFKTMGFTSTLSLRCPVVARPSLRARPARLLTVAPRASLSDVGRYLSEAMSQIFTPQVWPGYTRGAASYVRLAVQLLVVSVLVWAQCSQVSV